MSSRFGFTHRGTDILSGKRLLQLETLATRWRRGHKMAPLNDTFSVCFQYSLLLHNKSRYTYMKYKHLD